MRRLLVCAIALVTASCGRTSSESFTPTAPTISQSALQLDDQDESASTPDGDASHRIVTLDPSEIAALTGPSIKVSGTITDKGYPKWKISGATLTATPGAVTTRTSSVGVFSLRLRTAIAYTIKIAKTGYTTASIRK